MIHIYALIDPRTDEIKYIGKTKNKKRRFYEHLTESGKYKKVRWIQKLLKLNLQPIMFELDLVPTVEQDFWEQHWIALVKSWGYELLNHTIGGGNPPIVRKFGDENSFKLPGVKEQILAMNKARKNKTWVDLYGVEKAQELKTQSSQRNSGAGNSNHKGSVYQFDKEGNLVNTWSDTNTAAKELKFQATGITRCINGQYKSAHGFIWRRSQLSE